MQHTIKLPLVLEPQPEGGYTVYCPFLPGLITEADTLDEVLPNAQDALEALVAGYMHLGRPLPDVLQPPTPDKPLLIDTLFQVEIEVSEIP